MLKQFLKSLVWIAEKNRSFLMFHYRGLKPSSMQWPIMLAFGWMHKFCTFLTNLFVWIKVLAHASDFWIFWWGKYPVIWDIFSPIFKIDDRSIEERIWLMLSNIGIIFQQFSKKDFKICQFLRIKMGMEVSLKLFSQWLQCSNYVRTKNTHFS